MLEMARRCAAVNRDVLGNSRVEIRHADAREVLMTAGESFDLIVSEPSNPYRAGVASLFTREFYRAARGRLNESGLFLQWLQAYEIDDDSVRRVIATMAEQFPRVDLWRTKHSDLLLVGYASPAERDSDLTAVRQAIAHPTMRQALAIAWGVDDLEGVAARYVAGDATLRTWLSTGDQAMESNSDDRNHLEYAFAKSLGRRSNFRVSDMLERARLANDLGPIEWRDDLSTSRVDCRRVALAHRTVEEQSDGAFGPAHTVTPISVTGLTETAVRLAGVLSALRGGAWEEAANGFAELPSEADCPIVAAARALAAARSGRELEPHHLQRLAAVSPNDRQAFEVWRALRDGRSPDVENATIEWLIGLQQSPWTTPALSAGPWIGVERLLEADRDIRERAFRELALPLAANRFEYRRLAIRFTLAETLGDQPLVEALSEYEPWIPWKEYLLEARADAYRRTGSKLNERAQAEWEAFRREP